MDDPAIDIATSGYLTGNLETSGIIRSFYLFTPPDPEEPVEVTDNNGYQTYTYGSGAVLGGFISGSRRRYITVEFTYLGETHTQTRAINPNLDITIENLQIEVINNRPVVTLKNFIKLGRK